MKISKFLIVLAIATTITLGYVHQQIEIVKVDYQMKIIEENLTNLLDHNHFLLYNLTAIKAPHNLEHLLLAKDVTFELPAPYQLVRINQPQFKGELSRWERMKIAFASIFALSSNAEAKMVNKNK
jgi:glycine cleavage system regulatory protein